MRAVFALLTAILLLICVFGAFGCAYIGSALETAGGAKATDNGGNVSVPSAAPTEASDGAISDIERENPVHMLIKEFMSDWSAASAGIVGAAAESGDAELAAYCMELFGCENELALVDATVGLMSGEGQGWSGSLTDNYAGSGAMSSRGVFEFDMEDGRVIAGHTDEDALYAYIGYDISAPNEEPTPDPAATAEAAYETAAGPTPEPTPEPTGSAALAIVLKRTGDGWMLTLTDEEGCRAMSVANQKLAFAVLPKGFPAERLAQLTELTPAELGTAVLCYAAGAAELMRP